MDRQSAFIFAIAIALSSSTSAQTRVGFHVGTQISTLSRGTHSNLEWNWIGKVSGGISLDVACAESFLLAAQMYLVQKWSGLNESPFTEPASYTVYHFSLKGKHLEIPLYLRWRPINTTIKWFAEVGPTISFLVSVTGEKSITHQSTWTEDGTDGLHNTDVAIVAGSGLEVEVLRSICLTCSVHYTYGLVPVWLESSHDWIWIGVQADCGVMFIL
jgi:hypothetical protein